MLSQLRTLEPGVVSISGFPSAFPHDDDFYPLNANRENFAETPHRQIWWMPVSFTDRFLRLAPDLNSWFLIRPCSPKPRTPASLDATSTNPTAPVTSTSTTPAATPPASTSASKKPPKSTPAGKTSPTSPSRPSNP